MAFILWTFVVHSVVRETSRISELSIKRWDITTIPTPPPPPRVLTTEGNLKRLQWEEKEMA